MKSFNITIPGEVFESDLKLGAKVLFGLITRLCVKEGYCWATNESLAEMLRVDVSTVKRGLDALSDSRFIVREVIENRSISYRHIRINPDLAGLSTTGSKRTYGSVNSQVQNNYLTGSKRTLTNRVTDRQGLREQDSLKHICGKKENSIKEVFDFWKSTFKKTAARFSGDRARKIKARLDEKFTVDDLKQAIIGASRDKWLMGENDRNRAYIDFSTIFKTASKVEELIEVSRQVQTSKNRVVHNGFAECPLCRDLGKENCKVHRNKEQKI